MCKNILTLIVFFLFSLTMGQTSSVFELRKLNKRYDSILITYQQRAKDSLSGHSKKDRLKIMALYEQKVNKQRRQQNLAYLDKIKLEEDTSSGTPAKKDIKCKSMGNFGPPNFKPNSKYKATESPQVSAVPHFLGEVKSVVTFIVDEEGTVKNVRANGENEDFNREIELMFYTMEKKWTPVCVGGFAQANRFILPITQTAE